MKGKPKPSCERCGGRGYTVEVISDSSGRVIETWKVRCVCTDGAK